MILPIYISFDVTGDDIKKKIQFQSTTGRQKEFSFNRQKMVEFPQKWRVWLRVDLNESQLCAFEEEVFLSLTTINSLNIIQCRGLMLPVKSLRIRIFVLSV